MLDTLVVEKMGHATQYLYALGRGLQFVFKRPDLLLDTGILDKYVGNYDFGMTITSEGKILYVNFPSGRVTLHAQSIEIFYVNGVPGTTEFKKDETGKVNGFNIIGDGGTHFVKKKSSRLLPNYRQSCMEIRDLLSASATFIHSRCTS